MVRRSTHGIDRDASLGERKHAAGDRAERHTERGAGDDIGRVVHPHVHAAQRDPRRQHEVGGVNGEPASSTAAVNADAECPDGNELVIGWCMP